MRSIQGRKLLTAKKRARFRDDETQRDSIVSGWRGYGVPFLCTNWLRADHAIGYSPSDISYIALSHYHYDHTANSNAFASATWLVRQNERDAMFGGKYYGSLRPSTYSALEKSKTTIISTDEYDVFGDGSVVIKAAAGHTQGHQVLYVKLAKTGGVVLSGDLYHYPAEKALDRVPTFDFNQEQTRASRVALDAFMKKNGSQLWIQHDAAGNAKLKKSPEFYE